MTAAAGPGIDPQQLMIRRLIALGAMVVVIFVLVFTVKGCLSSRKEQALKDYNRDVASLMQDADANVNDFFTALTTGGTSAVDVASQINQLRLIAKSQTAKAQKLGVPGEMKPAQRNLLLSLGLIEEAMGKVAERIPSARSTDSATAEPAVLSVTAEMQSFVAADVVYKRRAAALIKQALDDHDIGGQTIQDSHFLPNTEWLDAPTVARRINADAGRGAGAEASTKPPSPGLHGHALLGVSVGDLTLATGAGSSNRIPGGANVTFNVKIANQGESPEADVAVRVIIRSSGKTITAQETVDQTTPGNETVVAVALKQAPPTDVAVKITVQVRKVPGETNTTNNTSEYPAIFEG